MKIKDLRKLILSAFFMALGIVLPMLTSTRELGNMLLPMHIPVLVCGFVCGWRYGVIVGFTLPLLRNFIFGMPKLYPVGIAMMFELAAYGFICGFLYKGLKNKKWGVFAALIASLIAGRIVLGLVNTLLFLFFGFEYSFVLFLSSAFINAVPGIVIQLVLIPPIVIALEKAKLLTYD